VKIADFGASKELTSLKKQTSGVGTPIYMAPEVLEGSTYSTSADVYSYAMLLLELYTGVEPYSNDRFPAPWHIARFISQGRRLPIPSMVPPFFSKLIRAGWKQNPRERPTFDEIITALTTGNISGDDDDESSSDAKSDTSSGEDEEQEKNTKKHHKGKKKHHDHHKKEAEAAKDDHSDLSLIEESNDDDNDSGDLIDYSSVAIVDTADPMPDESEDAGPRYPSRVRRLSISDSDMSDSEPLCSPAVPDPPS